MHRLRETSVPGGLWPQTRQLLFSITANAKILLSCRHLLSGLGPGWRFFFRSHLPRCVVPVPSIFFHQGELFWVAADIEEIIIGEFIFERRCPRPVECCAAPITSICDGSPEATSSQISVDILTPSRLLHFRDSHVYKYRSQAEKYGFEDLWTWEFSNSLQMICTPCSK